MLFSPELYNQRNEEKQFLTNKDMNTTFVNSREIRYCKLWVNIWFEQNGKKDFRRPVLVLKKVGALFLVCPLTTKIKDNKRHYLLPEWCTPKTSMLMLSQIKIVDKRRFMHKIGDVSHSDFITIQKIFQEFYFSEDL